jgi:hypothetical protein
MSWPRAIIEQLGREPRVGDWWCECCIEDLESIKTDEDLAALREFNEDGYTGQRYWPTEEAARAELADDGAHS